MIPATSVAVSAVKFWIVARLWTATTLNHVMNTLKTRSTGTVHTSTKARLTSVMIRMQIRIQIRIYIWILDPDCHQNLTICSLAHCQPSLKISCISVQKFLRKVANRQSNSQTDNNYTSSLVEVTRSTGTVHTSTKAHHTSATIWQISMSSRFMCPLTTLHVSQ